MIFYESVAHEISNVTTLWCHFQYAQSQYQFGSDITSVFFAFKWSHRRGATLTRAARRYAFCIYTGQAWILSDVTTKLLVTWIVDCILQVSNHKHKGTHFAAIPYTTQTFYGFSPQIRILAKVISRLISKLDRMYWFVACLLRCISKSFLVHTITNPIVDHDEIVMINSL